MNIGERPTQATSPSGIGTGFDNFLAAYPVILGPHRRRCVRVLNLHNHVAICGIIHQATEQQYVGGSMLERYHVSLGISPMQIK